ncbi:F-box/kelch-repeat protein At3g06240-like [Lotus japonicus]|uniref:F-box/kelch-repeat protein At3g06240-like n=1 Tax=Lotus japonicus TaxID=34305 RepID=UPI00258C8F20|nr:F-box/kelch-repeat protein At3g06240-like [Lotus japonicus]
MKTEAQHLPQDLITEILLRLPVKSLIRFKAVCKFWRSLISDPLFANSHFELATPRLVFSTRLGIQTMDLDGCLHSNPISEPINVDCLPTSSPIRILDSCRGFLLFEILLSKFLDRNASLYLWNPSTHVHKLIPPSPSHIGYHDFLDGFGYDSSKDDYLVVQVSCHQRCPPSYLAIVQIFSLRANMWKNIKFTDLPHLNLSCQSGIGVLFNGAFHWIVYDSDKSRYVIIAFDLMEERLFEIPVPNDPSQYLKFCELWVDGRFLSLSALRSTDTLEIWVMKNYKVQSSWSKSLVLSLSCFSYVYPICSTKRGDVVMDYRGDDKAKRVKYSDKGEQLEHREYGGYLFSQAHMYKESILSFPGVSE